MNHPSNCTIKAIHDYFNDGTLPEVGTVCEPNQSGFEVALAALEEAQGGNGIEKRSLRHGVRIALAKRGFAQAKHQIQNRDFDDGLQI
jgi:hypothetical protein